MRAFVTWLMALGVLAGLASTVLAAGHSHEEDHHHDHAAEHGHPSGGHGDSDPCEPAGDCPQDCPAGDHHHHACCHPMQLALDAASGCRLAVPESLRLGLWFLQLVPPDGPVFDLDKPPLI